MLVLNCQIAVSGICQIMINNNHWQLAPQSKSALLITQLIVQTRFNQTMKIYNVYLCYYAGLLRLRGICRDGQQNITKVSSDSQKKRCKPNFNGHKYFGWQEPHKGPLCLVVFFLCSAISGNNLSRWKGW